MRSMKRILCLILVLAMMAALPILTAAAAGKMAVGVATVNASALNMRTGAGTDNSVITSIGRGATVVVLEKTSDTWYKVSYNGTSGYVCAEYLSGFSATGELKASGKVMRPLQLRRKKQLERLGFKVFCVDGVEQIGGVIDEIRN